MSQHEGLPVSGYRPQSVEAVATVNASKVMEESVLRLLDSLASDPSIDKRWLAVGRTHIEQGFMAVNRAVFQPQRVDLPNAIDGMKTVFMTGYACGMDCDRDTPFSPQAEAAWQAECEKVAR